MLALAHQPGRSREAYEVSTPTWDGYSPIPPRSLSPDCLDVKHTNSLLSTKSLSAFNPDTSFEIMEPALQPPHGQTPNFTNPDSLSKWNTLCVSVCLSITTTVFFLRAYTRIAIKREWILEDCESFIAIMLVNCN